MEVDEEINADPSPSSPKVVRVEEVVDETFDHDLAFAKVEI